MRQKSILRKSMPIAAVVVLFIMSCGGSVNPLIWKTQFERRLCPQILIQPERMSQFCEEMEKDSDPHEMFEFIQSQIEYTNDFLTYGSLDHLPTAEEVLSSGKDDCDGQAVLLCSVLRYSGYEAYTVVGPSHAWVEMEESDSINYRGGSWFVKFNESSAEWNVPVLVFLVLEEFLLLTVFFSLVFYAHGRRVFTYFLEVLGYFKYVFLFFSGYLLIGIFILVLKSTLWIFGLVFFLISILLIVKVITKIRTYVSQRS